MQGFFQACLYGEERGVSRSVRYSTARPPWQGEQMGSTGRGNSTLTTRPCVGESRDDRQDARHRPQPLSRIAESRTTCLAGSSPSTMLRRTLARRGVASRCKLLESEWDRIGAREKGLLRQKRHKRLDGGNMFVSRRALPFASGFVHGRSSADIPLVTLSACQNFLESSGNACGLQSSCRGDWYAGNHEFILTNNFSYNYDVYTLRGLPVAF